MVKLNKSTEDNKVFQCSDCGSIVLGVNKSTHVCKKREFSLFVPIRAITKYNGKMLTMRGGVYLRPEVKRFESIIRNEAQKKFVGEPFKGNLRVNILFEFSDRKMPDLFNLPKAVCDALNKVVWDDDRQIISGTLNKCCTGSNSISIIVSEI